MKIRAFITWMLCFVMLLSGIASAESAVAGWLQKGWDWITEITGINTDEVKETVQGWVDTVGGFASEIRDNPEVQEAWNTLKEGALKAGTAGKEAVTKAYRTVLDWWLENGKEITKEAASALDGLAKAAGVEKAELAEWYSTVEEYISAHKETVTSGVKDAWELIKQVGTEAGDAAQEKLDEAYQTIREWLETVNDKKAKEAEEALGKIVNL